MNLSEKEVVEFLVGNLFFLAFKTEQQLNRYPKSGNRYIHESSSKTKFFITTSEWTSNQYELGKNHLRKGSKESGHSVTINCICCQTDNWVFL